MQLVFPHVYAPWGHSHNECQGYKCPLMCSVVPSVCTITLLPPLSGSHRSSYCYELVSFSRGSILEPYRRDFAFLFYKQTEACGFVSLQNYFEIRWCRSKCLCQTVFHSLDAVGRMALVHPFLSRPTLAGFPGWGCDGRAAVTFMCKLSSAYVCLVMPEPPCLLV